MSSPPSPPTTAAPKPQPSFRPPLWLLLLVLAFVLVPFLFWRGTWFGRRLSQEETGKYLADTEHPRKTQHALVQIAERIVRGDPAVKRWYPQVIKLAGHESSEVRSTVAWVMGQDNQAEEFRQALLGMLEDPDPLVRRNAALSLVRFGDAGGRDILRRMLQPYTILSPRAGTLSVRLQEDNAVNPGTLLGRVGEGAEEEVELRSPLPGGVQRWLEPEGTAVEAGVPLVRLSPGEDQVWEALRALYLVGEVEDLPEVERFARGVPGMPDRVRQQATLTAEAIRRRAAAEAETE
ncbi:HEAT repeat domain-containing protein [Acidobacteriia bacterium AH_259_A11_L15]|nr:HEAT repeat domain-containing protein [Acidobacteriia bacterium AH_259_A11_L15]